MGNDKKPEKEERTSTFSVEERSQVMTMPSISRLLNRKSFNLDQDKNPPTTRYESTKTHVGTQTGLKTQTEVSQLAKKAYVPEPKPPIFTQTAASDRSPEISIATETVDASLQVEMQASPRLETQAEARTNPALKIQPAQRRNSSRSTPQLIAWDLATLTAGTDPLGKGIAHLLQKGAKQVLFLSIQAPPPGSRVPHFLSTAAVQAKTRMALWSGLKWDPTEAPEVWNHLVKTGYVEFSPPGTLTNLNSNRNVVRAAFGLLSTEWLLLVRAGPGNACRGIVAIVSNQSMTSQLQEALPLLTSTPPAAA